MVFRLRHKVFAEYFGYPECCVESFLKNTDNFYALKMDNLYPNRPFKSTGYVTCHKCSHKTKEDLMYVISKKRLCSKPIESFNGETLHNSLKNCLKFGLINNSQYEQILEGRD